MPKKNRATSTAIPVPKITFLIMTFSLYRLVDPFFGTATAAVPLFPRRTPANRLFAAGRAILEDSWEPRSASQKEGIGD